MQSRAFCNTHPALLGTLPQRERRPIIPNDDRRCTGSRAEGWLAWCRTVHRAQQAGAPDPIRIVSTIWARYAPVSKTGATT